MSYFFRFSRMDTLPSIRYILMSWIPKNRQFANTFLQHLWTSKIEILNFKKVKYFILRPPKCPKWFLTWTKKKSIFWVFLHFIQTRKHILFRYKNYKFAHFRVTFKIFRGSALSQEAKCQSKILVLWPCNNLAQHEMCPIFFFKNHSTPECSSYCTVCT